MRELILGAVLVFATAAPAGAQQVTFEKPRMEVGVNFGVAASCFTKLTTAPTFTVNFAKHAALAVTVDLEAPKYHADGREQIRDFLAELRWALHDKPTSSAFVSVGVGGWWRTVQMSMFDRFHNTHWTWESNYAAAGLSIGGGFKRIVTSHLAIVGEGQWVLCLGYNDGLPLMVRAVVGVSIPIGHFETGR